MNDQLPSNHSGVRRGVSGGFTAEKDQGLTFECMYTLKHTHTLTHPTRAATCRHVGYTTKTE